MKLANVDAEKSVSAISVDDKDSPVLTEVKETLPTANQWHGWSEDIPVTTPLDIKSASEKKLEDEKLPVSTPVKGCTGKWGCGCTTCLEREDLWNAHMPSFKKNTAGKRCKCNNWDIEYGGFVCDGGLECKGYEDKSAKLPASSSTKSDAEYWSNDEDEKLRVLLKEDVVDDGW